MKIEAAGKPEFAQVVALLSRCDLPATDLTPDMLRHFLVVRNEDEVCGVGGLQILAPYALLRSVAVHPALRGRGYGEGLVESLEALARRLQIETIYLLTITAEQYFADRGYHRTDRKLAPAPLQKTAEFQSLCPDTAICMMKVLRT